MVKFIRRWVTRELRSWRTYSRTPAQNRLPIFAKITTSRQALSWSPISQRSRPNRRRAEPAGLHAFHKDFRQDGRQWWPVERSAGPLALFELNTISAKFF